MAECGSKCPVFMDVDCDLNPDSTRPCTLDFKERK